MFMTIAPPTRARWDVAGIAVAALLLGFLLVLQLRSVRDVRAERELPSRRAEELVALLSQADRAQAALHVEVDDLRRRLHEYEQLVIQGKEINAALAGEVEQYHVILGLTPLEGEGIEVLLRPGRGGPPLPGSVIQWADIAGVANELWAAGAEAVAINGQRILGRSAFSGVGPRVLIDGMQQTPPFRVFAIGEAAALENMMYARDGFVDGLRAVGLEVRVQRAAIGKVPAYRAPLVFRWAQPVP
ncbi:MAG: DUF881 domain-containing protein [Armatimonadetes bacterium]|nr:DUF881 domain-containing protein [Armatimonadota bacterium]